MQINLEFSDTTLTIVLLSIAILLTLTKRFIRNLVKMTFGLYSVFGWHQKSLWKTKKLNLPSINPHTGNMEWAQYEKRQFFVWLRQWAFNETRWLPPRNVGDGGQHVASAYADGSAENSRRIVPGTVVRGDY